MLSSAEDLAELEETLSVLGDAAALADIRETDQAYARGDVVRGADAVRQLRSDSRRAVRALPDRI